MGFDVCLTSHVASRAQDVFIGGVFDLWLACVPAFGFFDLSGLLKAGIFDPLMNGCGGEQAADDDVALFHGLVSNGF